MTVTCPGCGWTANVPEEKIPDGGATATCRKCQVKFEVKKELKPVAEQPSVSPPSVSRETKLCPLCGEEILSLAKKCKHCGSMLDGVIKEGPLPPVKETIKTVGSQEVKPSAEEPKLPKTSISPSRKPLSTVEKAVIIIVGLAIIGGLSKGDPSAGGLLFIYVGALIYRLRKKKDVSGISEKIKPQNLENPKDFDWDTPLTKKDKIYVMLLATVTIVVLFTPAKAAASTSLWLLTGYYLARKGMPKLKAAGCGFLPAMLVTAIVPNPQFDNYRKAKHAASVSSQTASSTTAPATPIQPTAPQPSRESTSSPSSTLHIYGQDRELTTSDVKISLGRYKERKLFKSCTDKVKEGLVAPSTATFDLKKEGYIKLDGADFYTVAFTCEAKNRLGVPLPSNYMCTVNPDSGNVYTLTEDSR